jgi:2-hydroxychromene-2-carboxylate isomerase
LGSSVYETAVQIKAQPTHKTARSLGWQEDMARRAIRLYFEFNSFYSYPAVHTIRDAARREGLAVHWRPFLLWPVLKARGHSVAPFQGDPAKSAYLLRDAERVAASAGLALRLPPDFPHNTVLAARIACSFQEAPWAFDFIAGVYAAEFQRGENVGSDAVLSSILTRLGIEPAAVLAEAQSAAGKAKLKAQTDEAIALGIFGAPTFVVESGPGEAPELFWGQDRVGEAVAWALGRHALQVTGKALGTSNGASVAGGSDAGGGAAAAPPTRARL